ncbi:F-box only protein 39-like [Physella acuta]|uniref:F-box only protein 39-like n=1 Tax=Physella acuta TaxID=109671 RepID=UPI0027DBDCAC|nr:F-box only protein 39-like [Physella acuta]
MPLTRKHPCKGNYKNTTEGINHWYNLPNDVMENIFKYFPQKDMFRLATVCQSWRNMIYTTPHFWRNMHLKLSCNSKSLQNKKTFWLATKVGGFIRELRITCDHQHASIGCKCMANHFRKVLIILQPTSLTSIKVLNLELKGAMLSTVSNISQVMTRMLSSLDRLHCFQMSSAQWPLKEGVKVMDTVLTVSRGTLQSLVIDGFFDTTAATKRPAEFERVTNGILSLNRLTKLGIDYQLLTDSFVTALSRSHTGQLKVLKIVASKLEENTPLIKERAWLCLTKACPEMKVAFTIDGIHSFEAIYNALDPDLPIKKIRLRHTPKRRTGNWYLSTMVAISVIIKNRYRHLVKFDLDIKCKHMLIDTVLLLLVKECKELLYVKTTADLYYSNTMMVVDRVLQQRKRQCPELPRKRARTNRLL